MRSGIDRKIIILRLLIICCCFVQIACSQQNAARQQQNQEIQRSEAENHIANAVRLQRQGNFRAALPEQLKAVELLPDDAGQLVVLASIYLRLKDYDNAKITAQKAVERIPNDILAHEVYAIVSEEIGDKQEALEQRLESSNLSPNDARLLTNLGVAYGSLENKNLQRNSYEKALAADPNYLPALYNLALLEAEEKNNQKAIAMLKEVIEKSSPENKERTERAKAKIKELEQPKK